MKWNSRMKQPILALIWLVVLQSSVAGSLDISISGGGYSNVVVAIGNDLQKESCDPYVDNIKAMIESASSLMYSATGNRMFFSDVIILIPNNWTSCSTSFDPNLNDLAFEDAHIRVQSSHPFFGNNPWTQQPRGCGEPGDYIYFSDAFINAESPIEGSQGKVFVHEWAKFRWGVFEEYGHPGDSIFPSVYRASETEWLPNYCTDGTVDGSFEPGSCSGVEQEADCTFTPEVVQTGNVTSSLLAVPFITNVNTFCSKDNHNTTAPTKHNFMCDKLSTWEVIEKHPDITGTPAGSTAAHNVTFSLQKMAASKSNDKLVFILDVTVPMDGAYHRWQYLYEAIKQFILVKVADGTEVGFLPLSSSRPLPADLFILNSTNRGTVAEQIPYPTTFLDNTKSVVGALAAAVEILNGTGKIILVTENLSEHVSETAEDLVIAANGLAVQPILYPAGDGISTAIYDPVAAVGELSPKVVNNIVDGAATGKGIQSVENNALLTNFIQDAGRAALSVIAADIDKEGSLEIILTVNNVTNYESDFFIEVLSYDLPAEAIPTVLDPSGEPMINPVGDSTSRIYQSSNRVLMEGKYTIRLDYPTATIIQASIVSIAKNAIWPYKVTVSASKPLDDLEYGLNPPTAPILYATLSDGIHPIVFAKVTATITTASGAVISSLNLTLNDNGVGGDVTGNDGTYSSYLVGIENSGTVSISVSASDNNGTAKIVRATSSMNAAPVNPGALGRACCGSSLIIPDTLLEDIGTFSVGSTPGLSGLVIGPVPPPNSYPPGRVTDLKGIRNGDEVSLTFTATGEDFNIGQATSYTLRNTLEESFTQELNASADAGTVLSMTTNVVCDTMYSFTVVAIDSLNNVGDASNEVHVVYPCSVSGDTTLTAGAIAGIVIGCIFFVILIVILICACMKSDGSKDSKIGHIFACQCCKKKDGKDKKTIHLVAPRTGRDNNVIRSRPAPQEINAIGHIRATSVPVAARTVEDLHRSSNHNQQDESDTDGGFRHHHMQQGSMHMSDIRDDSSETSSVPSQIDNYKNRPMNQVGVPLPGIRSQYKAEPSYNPNYGPRDSQGYTNQGYYNDSESGAYSVSQNKRPILPPVTPRNNTRV